MNKYIIPDITPNITADATVQEFRNEVARYLESGLFTQGWRTLTLLNGEDRRDCCLGVACTLGVQLGLLEYRIEDETDSIYIEYSGDIEYLGKNTSEPEWRYGALPGIMAEKLGMTPTGILSTTSLEPANDASNSLVDMNDNHGMDFKVIAETFRTGTFITLKDSYQ